MRATLIWGALLAAAAVLASPLVARAQSSDPYAAGYCEPLADTKLLYTNRGYLILPKPKDAPSFYYSYLILGTGKKVERRGQLMFDDGDDRWDFDSHLSTLEQLWPLRPDKRFELDRTERTTGMKARVTFTVLGLEPIKVEHTEYKSWKIRRLDRYEDGHTFVQFLWYSPELCTLAAFTDWKNRNIKLLRVLKPGDKDYARPIVVKNRKLYFADTNELVK
ncbi:MAG TPA: hypothetical protein VMU06_15815 [Stellaceae bacterium]|nr:hypothetical protein [Stellaceae bacterium]